MARVFVIDDDPELRGFVRQVLTQDGHEVEEAADGEAGLNALRSGSFDLVVCDLFMPGQEGIKTILEIRRQLPNMPVIAVSGGGLLKLMTCLESAAALGAVVALPKPFTPQVLRDVVADLLEGRRPWRYTCTTTARLDTDASLLCPTRDTCPYAGSSVACGAEGRLPLGMPHPAPPS